MIKLFGSVNKTIKILVFGNALINMADGFLAPVFAVFVTQKIAPDEVRVVGLAIAIYWLVKSVLQLPLARYLDKTDGERDDYWAMLIGGVIFVVAVLFYSRVDSPLELYILQAFWAIGGSLFVVPWASLFTRHVDKFRIGFEWSLNSSAVGLGLMVSTAIGGYLADKFGFYSVFIVAAIFYALGTITFLFLKPYIKQLNRLEKAFPEQRQRHIK